MCLSHRVNINNTTGELSVARPLDYETLQSFVIIVTASDNPGGAERNTVYDFINITVEDANDNSPVFTHSVYSVTVKENAAQFWYTVTANDNDSGQYIMYLIIIIINIIIINYYNMSTY